MTSKERVHAALNRQPVDRVPIFMWYHPDTAARLASELEIAPGELAEAMGDDVRQAWVGNNYAMEGIVHERDGEGHTDYWGIKWVKTGPFNQIARSPLADALPDEARAYRYPYDRIDALMENMAPVMAERERYFVGCDVSPCLAEMIYRLRGMEETLLDFAADRGLASDLVEAAARFSVALSEEACRRFPLDWLWTGDDIGGQLGMIINPQIWRAIVKPWLERIMAVGKRHGLWVAYHSCGAIRPIIPDLIEIGLDVLNPIQAGCPGMDAYDLKREYGRHLAFMGGLDTIDLMPYGSADEVRREAGHLIEVMTGDGGGYILAASHTIPPETPLDNIFALYEVTGVSRTEIADRAAGIRARRTD